MIGRSSRLRKGSYFNERNGGMALIHNIVIMWIAGTPIGEDKQTARMPRDNQEAFHTQAGEAFACFAWESCMLFSKLCFGKEPFESFST